MPITHITQRPLAADMTRPLLFARKSGVVQYLKPLTTGATPAANFSCGGQKLPRLPVPPLEQTVAKYLKSVKPLLNDQEYKCTESVACEFQKGCGQELQKFLVDRAKCSENWLADWWNDVAYLSYRNPVVVWSSPGQTFPPAPVCTEEERLTYAARVIQAMIEYKKLIDSDMIPVDKMGKEELDMQQYRKIFGTNRLPCLPSDRLEFNPRAKHIVVAYNNNFFQVDVFADDCSIPNTSQLVKQLKFVVENGREKGPAVGILTAGPRDNWADAYQHLSKNAVNRDSLCTISKALFVVCLDSKMKDASEDRMTRVSQQLIHGGGSFVNGANRWYDKTVQYVIGTDGLNGLSYEHSPAEGVPIAVMTDFVVNYLKSEKCGAGTKCLLEPRKLCFDVDCKAAEYIKSASNTIDKLVCDLDVIAFSFNHYGKEFIKSQKYSPDSYIQMAQQFAFYRLHKTPAAHYESAATRKFLHGRTETIRSCSQESVCFAKAMLDNSMGDCDKIQSLTNAIKEHKKYSVEAVNGLGVDRHLLGLKLAAGAMSVALPALFNDVAYKRSTHMRISSSQVATKSDCFMAYGPLVMDGYGCCYNPRADNINFALTSFRSDVTTSTAKFREALEQSLMEMQALLCRNQKSKL